MKGTVIELLKKQKELEEKLYKIKKAIYSLQEICEHNYISGFESQYESSLTCSKCLKESK